MEDIKANENFLGQLYDVVNSAIKAGKSEEEIMKITSIKGASEWKGNGIDRCLTAAYQEITSK